MTQMLRHLLHVYNWTQYPNKTPNFQFAGFSTTETTYQGAPAKQWKRSPIWRILNQMTTKVSQYSSQRSRIHMCRKFCCEFSTLTGMPAVSAIHVQKNCLGKITLPESCSFFAFFQGQRSRSRRSWVFVLCFTNFWTLELSFISFLLHVYILQKTCIFSLQCAWTCFSRRKESWTRRITPQTIISALCSAHGKVRTVGVILEPVHTKSVIAWLRTWCVQSCCNQMQSKSQFYSVA